MAEDSADIRRAPSNTGNPRITVAFPFSKIDIRDPEPALADLAVMLRDLAQYVAALSHELSPDTADAADRLADRATSLATV
jgi:hypothetical protein